MEVKGTESKREIGRCYASDFEDEERGHEQRMQVTSRNWKRQGNRLSLKPPEEMQPC